MSVSIGLINVIGFLTCGTILSIGAKSVYDNSKIVVVEEDNIKGDNQHVVAEVVGLGIEIVGYGLDVAEDKTDKVFNLSAPDWIKSLQVKPDNRYLNSYATNTLEGSDKESGLIMEL
ncbi:hypothetical protein [Paenisporosarcina sp. TG20]|uniref:hypothetical protein n=1 Tax=Paenisporosarcina sp. TG20 TaxID=1211706 RepID=UPI0002EBB8BF|nr:hypothetical protein [Paenisporosarcina sp. TG20]